MACCCRRLFCLSSKEENIYESTNTRSMPSVAQRTEEPTSEGPEWLDLTLVEDALQLGGERDVQVTKILVRSATAPGDNYGSALYRVKAVLADGGERSLLVKAPPLTELVAKAIAEVGLFPRETSMLARILPQMEAILEEAAPGRYPPLAPRCPLHGKNPVDFLVLEDLTPQGFIMADRQRGMGLRHSLLAFRALARFHAASAALLARDSSVSEGLDNPLRRQNDTFTYFFTASLDNAAKACRSWAGFEEYGDYIDAFKEGAVAKMTEMNDAKIGAFNVVLHGDFWVNNIMYRYEKQKPKELRFVDFQASHVASPALDIMYILSTSLSEDVWENHSDLLVREYHRALVETMKSLGLQAPSLEALQADLDAHGALAVYSVVVLYPIMKATKTPDIDAAVSGDQDAGAYMFQDPTVKRWLQRVLPEYKQKGWLG